MKYAALFQFSNYFKYQKLLLQPQNNTKKNIVFKAYKSINKYSKIDIAKISLINTKPQFICVISMNDVIGTNDCDRLK